VESPACLSQRFRVGATERHLFNGVRFRWSSSYAYFRTTLLDRGQVPSASLLDECRNQPLGTIDIGPLHDRLSPKP
jgi:hypothetical protein